MLVASCVPRYTGAPGEDASAGYRREALGEEHAPMEETFEALRKAAGKSTDTAAGDP